MSKKKTHEQFESELRKINPNIVLLSKYDGGNKKIQCRCIKCGNEWSVRAVDLLRGHGCAECAHPSKRKTIDQFRKDLKTVNNNIIVTGKYVNNSTKIKCKCSICGHEWQAKPNALLNGRGCPNCNHTATSFMEQFISESLIAILGEERVKRRDRKTIGKELDIYVPALRIAIEPGSWHWHADKISNDKEKASKKY